MFGCSPDVAERQDAQTIDLILDYRVRRRAVEVYRMGKEGIPIMTKEPILFELLVEMMRAQLGDSPGMDWQATVYGTMQTMPTGDDEDE